MNDKNGKPVEPEESGMNGKIDYDEIRKLVGLLEEKNLAVFELEVEGFKVKIARNQAAPAPGAAPLPAPPAGAVPETAAAAEARIQAAEIAKGHHLITSPMVGTFYRAPDPTSPPFADIGDVVKKGKTLCIIEAMKLMNEIEAEVRGRLVKILVENGQPVEFGQTLFLLEPA